MVLLVTPSDVNAGIAGTSMELVANSLGVGMLYVGFFSHLANTDPQIRDYLGLPEGAHIGATLAIGYPDVTYYRSAPRKKVRVQWR